MIAQRTTKFFFHFSLSEEYRFTLSNTLFYCFLIVSSVLVEKLLFLFTELFANTGLDLKVGSTPTNWLFYLSSLLISPIVEEFLFRWVLKEYTPLKVSVFIIGIISSIIGFFQPTIPQNGYLLFVIPSLTVGFLILLTLLIRKYNAVFYSIYSKSYSIIFAVSVLIFSYSHISHFCVNDFLRAIIYSPLMFLPFIWFGFFISIIRIKFGFLHAVIGHILANTILLFI